MRMTYEGNVEDLAGFMGALFSHCSLAKTEGRIVELSRSTPAPDEYVTLEAHNALTDATLRNYDAFCKEVDALRKQLAESKPEDSGPIAELAEDNRALHKQVDQIRSEFQLVGSLPARLEKVEKTLAEACRVIDALCKAKDKPPMAPNDKEPDQPVEQKPEPVAGKPATAETATAPAASNKDQMVEKLRSLVTGRPKGTSIREIEEKMGVGVNYINNRLARKARVSESDLERLQDALRGPAPKATKLSLTPEQLVECLVLMATLDREDVERAAPHLVPEVQDVIEKGFANWLRALRSSTPGSHHFKMARASILMKANQQAKGQNYAVTW